MGLICGSEKESHEVQFESSDELVKLFDREVAQQVQKLLGSVGNEETPLVKLDNFGVYGSVYMKDESKRLGVQSFKASGGTFALARQMCKELRLDIEQFNDLQSLRDSYNAEFGQTTFVTATDGNHGRGLAWAAKQLGQNAVVFMPKGTQEARIEHIEKLGARVEVTSVNYDDTVEIAFTWAKENKFTVVQDTAFDNYTEIPTWICQGYCLLAEEACNRIPTPPTHVFLQVGVGSFASAVTAFLVNRYPENTPKIITLEPFEAACLFKSGVEGKMCSVGGDLETMMAGLACGVPSTLAWPILRDHVTAFMKINEQISGNGMRELNKQEVEAGECGAASYGILQHLKDYPSDMECFGLDKNSNILLINTEGATDPINYKIELEREDLAETKIQFHMNQNKL